ncbi:MAG: DUF1957 domain-containing protein [Spirochaetales bacterium]|jgi:1,4-alpha-glucan branching enzyme|nr:DUF1957 domain-containing protein [Spirochaetales bacterium]
MSYGFLSLVLHAHLPFVRHPEHDRFLEEDWLYEAISETYLPLLRVFNRLKADQVPFRLTLSMSPTLSAMLTDELLQERYVAYCLRMIDLSVNEIKRTSGDKDFAPLAEMYHDLLEQNLDDFENLHKRNLAKAFRAFEKDGHLEIITTSATHSFLPLYQQYPNSVEMQINTAVISHGRIYGSNPQGFWLPECGFYPGLERFIKANGMKYFFTAAHGVLFADQRSPYGVYSPLELPNGTAAFGRDIPSSQAVWSSEEGYPGDFSYRDFYRDIGFDLPLDYVGPWIHNETTRINTGFKYYAITGKTEDKKPYNPEEALRKAEEHAENFLYNRQKQLRKLTRIMDIPPIIVSPYDAELFGHWWFEGPQWLEFLIRKIHSEGKNIILATPGDYISKHRNLRVGVPSFSSWGNNGYAEVWLDGSNDWIYRHVHKAIERMGELVERFPDEKGLKLRTLNQAAREVLLSQASDWAFIMKTGTTVQYATRRMKEHLYNFNRIYDGLCRNSVSTEWLTRLEKKNNLFSDIDYRLFVSKRKKD